MTNSSTVRFLRVFLGLLTLTTFAIAQSVYQAIVGNPEFVQLNRVTHGDLLLIVLVFNVVPAAVFALVWAFIQRWNSPLAAGFLSVSFFSAADAFSLRTPQEVHIAISCISSTIRYCCSFRLAVAAIIAFR